ncbi:MAG: hypothetical protein KatS3mg129_0069 [Leptospiraceae bacterium]|nr:MAG: hypothetical protein KatS3mg129_0069 [Leptospiraceae bacterium]
MNLIRDILNQFFRNISIQIRFLFIIIFFLLIMTLILSNLSYELVFQFFKKELQTVIKNNTLNGYNYLGFIFDKIRNKKITEKEALKIIRDSLSGPIVSIYIPLKEDLKPEKILNQLLKEIQYKEQINWNISNNKIIINNPDASQFYQFLIDNFDEDNKSELIEKYKIEIMRDINKATIKIENDGYFYILTAYNPEWLLPDTKFPEDYTLEKIKERFNNQFKNYLTEKEYIEYLNKFGKTPEEQFKFIQNYFKKPKEKPDKYILIVHPFLEGRNLDNAKNNNYYPGRHICVQKNGFYNYTWTNPGENKIRHKVAFLKDFIYNHHHWIAGSALYEDEVYIYADTIKKRIQLISFVVIAIIGLLIILVIRNNIIKPINILSKEVRKITNEIYEPIPLPFRKDEIGILIQSYNSMITELKTKKNIEDSFGKYLPPQLRDAILKNQIPLEGERKEIVILFLDIRDFTTLSSIYSPIEIVELLNQFFDFVSNSISKNYGMIDKFIGDAVMAIFGTPIDLEKPSINAMNSIKDIFQNLREFNSKRILNKKELIDISIGIHKGEAIVGNIGSKHKLEYTAIGDSVNLASRVQGLCKAYKTNVILTDNVYKEILENQFEEIEYIRELDSVRVKGRPQPVVIYEYFGFKNESEINLIKNTMSDYMQGISFYKLQQWEEAAIHFRKVLNYNPNDTVAKVYLNRCNYFYKNPPPIDWDGVFDYKHK